MYETVQLELFLKSYRPSSGKTLMLISIYYQSLCICVYKGHLKGELSSISANSVGRDSYYEFQG